ncbi:MAG TPA: hypothetical protein VGS22_26340 [Thermoanaerobaculia bacterium]|jgi:hypothetical protein|nr:hypothetical protein [Thermoanaerobaculia bacterium]
MGEKSYAARLDRWQSTVQNIQEMIHQLPGVDATFELAWQKVMELRETQADIQRLEGQRKESVVRRRHLDREAEQAIRRLAALARAHMGFANPLLETFGVRSEDRGRRARSAKEPAKSTEAVV